jgi:ribose transport system permease protein
MSNNFSFKALGKILMGKWFIFILCALVFIIFATIAPAVISFNNVLNILVDASIIAIAGAGMTFAITLGGFDLSVGSVLALTTCVIAKMIPVVGIFWAIIIAFAVAVFIGFINGLIITKLKIQTFVATLATQIIIQGIALIYTGGVFVSILRYTQMKFFSSARILGIPLPIIITIIIYILSSFLYRETKFGVFLRASGSNEKAAYLSAISVSKITILVFMITALTAAISGLITVSQILTGGAIYGSDFALSAITVVVLGGTNLSGGSGFLGGTLVASIMISVIENGLTILGYSDDIQRLTIGLILIVALTIKTILIPYFSEKGSSRE